MANDLLAKDVSVSFDGLNALSAVTLEVVRGKTIGLIGPNGAGKTTLVNVLTGFQKPASGHVLLADQDVTSLQPHKIRHMGIARTFQSGRLFTELSVIDNLEVTGVGLGHSRLIAAREAERVLDWMGIIGLAERLAGGLPYTDERRVAIGRALMFNPGFLLLDEPAAGMSAAEADELAELIRRIVNEVACGVLLIEHNIGLVLRACEIIYVLDSGEVIEAGPPAQIQASEKVRHAYMGTQREVLAESAAGGVVM